jgi:hypothetical protein
MGNILEHRTYAIVSTTRKQIPSTTVCFEPYQKLASEHREISDTRRAFWQGVPAQSSF